MPTARTSFSANGSSSNRIRACDASARDPATIVAVTPTLEANLNYRSLLVQPPLRPRAPTLTTTGARDLVIWDNLALQHGRPNVRADGPPRTLRKVASPVLGLSDDEIPSYMSAR